MQISEIILQDDGNYVRAEIEYDKELREITDYEIYAGGVGAPELNITQAWDKLGIDVADFSNWNERAANYEPDYNASLEAFSER